MRAAIEARERVPGTPVLILSQYVEESYAGDLLASDEGGVGYLLKDRVADVRQFTESLQRVAGGGTAMDPEVVAQLLGRRDNRGPLGELTPRELEVLTLMAEGRSNTGIGVELGISASSDREARQAGVHEARPAALRQRPPARPRGAQVPRLERGAQRQRVDRLGALAPQLAGDHRERPAAEADVVDEQPGARAAAPR